MCPASETTSMTTRLFTLDRVIVPSFPHPSLALTSTLGNIYLPFLLQPPSAEPSTIPNADSRSRLCLILVGLLAQSPILSSELEQAGEKFKVDFLCTLFLHSAFAKDYLAYPAAMSNWSIFPGFNETDLLDFQSNCFSVLERVCFHC